MRVARWALFATSVSSCFYSVPELAGTDAGPETGVDAPDHDAAREAGRDVVRDVIRDRVEDRPDRTEDRPPSDAPIEAGLPPGCAGITDGGPAGLLFCDGFETGDLSRWDLVTGGVGAATLGVDSVEVFRGSYAAHAAMTLDVQDGSFMSSQRYAEKYLSPLGSGTFALRAYVYLAQAQSDTTAFFALTHQATFAPDALEISIECADMAPADCGGTQGIAVTKTAFATDAHIVATTLLTPMTWNCFEWVVSIGDATTGRVTLYQNGAPILDDATVTLDPGASPYDAFLLGYVRTPGSGAQQVFFDDVVLATRRVPCEKAAGDP